MEVKHQKAAACNAPTSILDLNVDCLWQIIDYLDLMAQINLSQVCRHMKAVVEKVWQCNFKSTTLDGFQSCYQNDADFKKIFKHLNNFIIELKIQHLEARKLRLLSKLNFTNCKKLVLHDWHLDYQDDDMGMVAKMFPQLVSFTPKTPCITGANISDMLLLEQLNLSYCTGLAAKYLPLIFKKLKLKVFKMRFNCYEPSFELRYDQHIASILCGYNLRQLELDDYQLSRLTANKQLLQLPNLKHVKCYVRDYLPLILRDLKLYHAKEIQELTALEDNVAMQVLSCLEDGVFVNLSKLTIANSCLRELPLQLVALKELHLVGCNLSQSQLLSGMQNCCDIRILNITRSKGLDADFLKHLIAMLNESTRNAPLLMLIKDSCLDASLVNHHDILRSSQVLKLSLDVLQPYLDITHFEFVLKHYK